MEDDDDIIYQGDFYKLSESRKRLIGSKSDSWKPKYIILRKKGEKPVLEYHKKKPKSGKKSERTLTDAFELWPSFKVEKLKNARGRIFVCEITSPEFHIFISADEEKEIDVFVFLLQVQIRLKDNIREDLISVLPDDSESQQQIGAKGSKCVLHASPWGLTLALEKTRALLAQWPLKSIRYYETSGGGIFNIEAGRVAPMGEGLYRFKTQSGDDDFMYDLVDNYIVNTLDRVKPTQKGTPEEIEDYIREHECLHSLTTISVCSTQEREIRNILKQNWNIGSGSTGERGASSSASAVTSRNRVHSRPSPSSSSSRTGTQSSSLVINLERPGESSDSRRNSSDSRSSRRPSNEDGQVTGRRPPLPSRQGHGSSSGVPRRSKRRDHSIPRKVDVISSHPEVDTNSIVSEASLASPATSPRRHSNPANIVHRVNMKDENSRNPLTVNTDLGHAGNNTHQHTEFYHLSSPNMKIRKSKSPVVVTKNPNKVGRAEYLLSLQSSGVKSPSPSISPNLGRNGWDLKPSSAGEEEHQERLDYLDAIARASQEKYGGHNSIDRRWGKLRRDLSTSDQSTTSGVSSTDSPRVSVNLNHPSGYVNLQGTAPKREIHHGRQRSAPEDMSASQYSRQNSQDSIVSNQLSPPSVGHLRQRSAEETSFGSIDPRAIPSSRPQSADSNNRRDVGTPHHSRQNSVTSAVSSQRRNSSDNGLEDGEHDNVGRQLSGLSGVNVVDKPVADWLLSASCEDLSDHMRTVIYEDKDDHPEQGNAYEEIDTSKVEDENNLTISSTESGTSGSKPPLPFTGLKKFQDPTDLSSGRDRSKSFGYMNLPNVDTSAIQSKPQSSAPSAHLIRKMVNARAKQETLRKSLSNPNFLNLGSKEHLFNLKSLGQSSSGSTTKLGPNHKQKSKSFGSLFPAIKKALSRESLGQSRSTTPERRGSRSTTPERRSSFSFRRRNSERRSSDSESNFKRQNSLHSVGEMTIKGIRMTERSRSFRRVRGAKSVEVLSKSTDDAASNRLSSATTVSSPAATSLDMQNSQEDSNRESTVTATNPNYTASAEMSLTFPDIPPVNSKDVPPPLPARKKTSEDISSSNSLDRKTVASSNGSGINVPSHYQNSPSNHQNESTGEEQGSRDRPHVSDLVAKLEVNNNEDSHRSRSEKRESLSKRLSSDHVPGQNRITTRQMNKPPIQKTNSGNQRRSQKGDKGKSDVPRGSGANMVSPRTSTNSQTSRGDRHSSSNQGVEFKRGSSSGSQIEGSSCPDSKPTTSDTQPPQSQVAKSVKPFQPLPFKRHQNGIRSVQPPASGSKPDPKS